MEWASVLSAREFARAAHGSQMYGGSTPYFVHLDMTVAVLYRFGVFDLDLVTSGYLHDVLEDTEVTKEELTVAYGSKVANLVDAVSDGEGKNRKERKKEAYRKINLIEDAVILKLADRISNVEATLAGVGNADACEGLFAMYQLEMKDIKDKLGSAPTSNKDITTNMWKHLSGLFTLGGQ